mgnify:CR=1 FL=1
MCVLLFFKRRDTFPRVFIALILGNLALTIFDGAVASLFLDAGGAEATTAIMRSLLSSAIWVPYMYLSTRVKKTFVVPYDGRGGGTSVAVAEQEDLDAVPVMASEDQFYGTAPDDGDGDFSESDAPEEGS